MQYRQHRGILLSPQFPIFLVSGHSQCLRIQGRLASPPTIKWKLSGDKDSQGHVFPRQRWIQVPSFNINIFQKVMENTKIADMLITSHWWPLYLFAFATSSRVGEPDFSLTCCCPLSLYPTSLMQISTAGRGGKCLDCIQAFPASTLPFSLALVTILTFDWSCYQRFYFIWGCLWAGKPWSICSNSTTFKAGPAQRDKVSLQPSWASRKFNHMHFWMPARYRLKLKAVIANLNGELT